MRQHLFYFYFAAAPAFYTSIWKNIPHMPKQITDLCGSRRGIVIGPVPHHTVVSMRIDQRLVLPVFGYNNGIVLPAAVAVKIVADHIARFQIGGFRHLFYRTLAFCAAKIPAQTMGRAPAITVSIAFFAMTPVPPALLFLPAKRHRQTAGEKALRYITGTIVLKSDKSRVFAIPPAHRIGNAFFTIIGFPQTVHPPRDIYAEKRKNHNITCGFSVIHVRWR